MRLLVTILAQLFSFSAGATEWKKVYSQTEGVLSIFDNTDCTSSSCNLFRNEDNFINFDIVRDAADENTGLFHFQLVWDDGIDDGSGLDNVLDWSQIGNPLALTQSFDSGLVAIDPILFPSGNLPGHFNGLSKSNQAGRTLIDGTGAGELWESWWYAVGYYERDLCQDGDSVCTSPDFWNPGYVVAGTDSGSRRQKTVLYLETVVPAEWSEWTSWGSCSVSCDEGTYTRERECSETGMCTGADTESAACFYSLDYMECPVWSEWSDWGSCSVSCDDGEYSRQRSCSEPDTCEGDTTEVSTCNEGACYDCENDTHSCSIDAECINRGTGYDCQCNDGYYGDGFSCVGECNLFIIECDVTAGFTVTIDQECKSAQYRMLPEDDSGIFIDSMDYQHPDHVDQFPSADEISEECKFSAAGTITLSFSDCRGAVYTVPTDTNYTTYTTYANHRMLEGTVSTSLMSQETLECRLSLITDIYQSEILDSSDSGFLISDGDKNSNDLIESGVLSSEFGLALVVGSQKNGVTQILTSDDEVDIGQKVRVMLQHTVTDYWFSLLDCKILADSGEIALYDGACPNPNLQSVEVNWVDHLSFDIRIFRVEDGNTLTFTCTAAMYIEEENMPESCNDAGIIADEGERRRKRRNDENSDKEGTDEEKTVTISIQIKSHALKSCASYLLPLIWLTLLML